jgi:hypothetical protein
VHRQLQDLLLQRELSLLRSRTILTICMTAADAAHLFLLVQWCLARGEVCGNGSQLSAWSRVHRSRSVARAHRFALHVLNIRLNKLHLTRAPVYLQ